MLWSGFLKAPESSLYRIHLETYEAAYHELVIDNSTTILSEFPPDSVYGASLKDSHENETFADIWLEGGSLVPI